MFCLFHFPVCMYQWVIYMSNVNVILNSVSKPLNSEQTLNSVAERVVCAEGTHSEVSTPLCSSCTCIVEQIYFSLELIFSFHSLLPTVQSQEAVKGRGNIHHWIGYVGYIIGYFFFPEICFTAVAVENMEVEMSSHMVASASSSWKTGLQGDVDPDAVHTEISTSQEMGYVCREFSTELTRKFQVRPEGRLNGQSRVIHWLSTLSSAGLGWVFRSYW